MCEVVAGNCFGYIGLKSAAAVLLSCLNPQGRIPATWNAQERFSQRQDDDIRMCGWVIRSALDACVMQIGVMA